jgi:hypothetical protein
MNTVVLNPSLAWKVALWDLTVGVALRGHPFVEIGDAVEIRSGRPQSAAPTVFGKLLHTHAQTNR